MKFEEILEKACKYFHILPNETLSQSLTILHEIKLNKTPILIFGNAGNKKSLLIRIFSYISSIFARKQFILHWIKLDSIEIDSFFGYFSEKKWKKGLFENLLEIIINEKELVNNTMNFSKKDISNSNFFNFCSDIANPELTERKSTINDWIILDNGSLGNFYETFFEMAINNMIYQENGRKMTIDPEISLFFEVFHFLFINKPIPFAKSWKI